MAAPGFGPLSVAPVSWGPASVLVCAESVAPVSLPPESKVMDPTSGKVAPASLGVLLLPKHAAVASGIAVTERQERRRREEDRSLTSRLLGKGTANGQPYAVEGAPSSSSRSGRSSCACCARLRSSALVCRSSCVPR